jgi:hypothetical protein
MAAMDADDVDDVLPELLGDPGEVVPVQASQVFRDADLLEERAGKDVHASVGVG